jgi:hypothetical protein
MVHESLIAINTVTPVVIYAVVKTDRIHAHVGRYKIDDECVSRVAAEEVSQSKGCVPSISIFLYA